MRKLIPLLLLTLAVVTMPAYAERGSAQSYITFDDGGTIVKQGDDGREIEARVNFPIYPGDEVTTGRRGRTEIRLADGNIIALDRATSVRFRSIYDSYESDASQSIVELKFGHVAVQRTDEATELLRIDTPDASYAANDAAVYAVNEDRHGRDRVTVYDGSIEVRTPQRSTRVRTGEEARIDDQGIYDLVNAPSGVYDEFERWFMRRSERYGATSKYLDRSLAYSDADLEENGSWIYAASYGGYAWRPHVSIGWRPYFYGRWGYGPGGCLTWISYEPWGWVPYHYGRWGYDPFYGWLWVPGYTYAPAWVYWAYGSGYIGWAPAGWYDCYRPYYNWAYQPYSRGADFGFGFYGRVRLNEVDLRPWTFVNPNHIVSGRVDQAALTTDAIRQRLIRDPNANVATVTGSPARFTRSELRDPATAISNVVRRGNSGGTAADMTPFFRRDAVLPTVVRERIVRSREPEPPSRVGAAAGVPTPGTRGTIEGRTGHDGTTSRSDDRPGEATGRVFRDPYQRNEPSTAGRRDREVTTPERNSSSSDRNWRSNHVDRTPAQPSTADRTDRTETRPTQQDNWRGRSVERGSVDRSSAPRDRTPAAEPRTNYDGSRGSDVPRRIIDRIGGARIYSGDAPRESTRSRESAPRESAPRESAPPPRQERSSPPPPPRESAPPRQERSSPTSSGGEHHDGGGRIHRG